MTEFKVHEWYRYSGNGRRVRLIELRPGNKGLVRWMTDGHKQPGRRFWIVPPQERVKVVRLSSLTEL